MRCIAAIVREVPGTVPGTVACTAINLAACSHAQTPPQIKHAGPGAGACPPSQTAQRQSPPPH